MSGTSPDGGTAPTAAELREHIDETREELGRTVEALAAKTDVKARAQAGAADARRRVRAGAGQAARAARRNRVRLLAVAAAAGTASLVAGLVLGRTGRRR
ncbi:DUF3618 domain-containing protein [Nocardiopsis trehalosi]|jgi:ABC-type hemin transport system substrate-binding protein|uniref:DUF3618 domain-containing protein n=1 Tax=Nocardiopsis trehalosi TaxID=109329 RepID=UPI00082A585D|nr:DUF3618 domain-containing protein [Nocardiopsis trehalosi]